MRLWLVIALLSSLLAGCHHSATPLRVGTNVWPGYEPLYLARANGYYSDGIKLVELPSASDVIDALRMGQLEAGALTLDEVLSLVQEGEDLVVILVFNTSMGADVMLARPDIRSLSDLRGRTIATETTAVGALMLHGALAQAGLNISDVSVRHLPLTEHLEAYRNGRADAVITFEPYASALAAAGAELLFDSSAIPGQIVDVLAVRRDALHAQHHNLKLLLDGYFRARHDMTDDPLASLRVMNQRLKMPEDELPRLFDGMLLPGIAQNSELLSGAPSQLTRSSETLATLMQQQQLLPAVPVLERFTSANWLPESP